MKTLSLIVLLILVSFNHIPVPSAAFKNETSSIYYVDATNGNDAWSGKAIVSAWKTLAKVNAASFQPGDVIRFKRGEIWREVLRVSSSGDQGAAVTFCDYGTGRKPIITGADRLPVWNIAPGNIWWARNPSYDGGWALFFNDTAGTHKSCKAALTADMFWWQSAANDTFWIYSNRNPATRIIEWAHRDECITVKGKHDVIIDRIWARQARSSGSDQGCIHIQGGSYRIAIQNCTVSEGTESQIQVTSSFQCTVSNDTVYSNVLYGRQQTVGIAVGAFGVNNSGCQQMLIDNNRILYARIGITADYTKSLSIVDNDIANCWAGGIGGTCDTMWTISNNSVHDVCSGVVSNAIAIGGQVGDVGTMRDGVVSGNSIYNVTEHTSDGNGIEIDIGAREVKVVGNIIHDVQGTGITFYFSDSCSATYNLIYNTGTGSDPNFHGGLLVSNNTHDVCIFNNTIYNPGENGIELSGGRGADSTYRIYLKNNIISGSTKYALKKFNRYVLTPSILSDHNDWYYTTGNMASWDGRTYATIELFREFSGLDRKSLFVDPHLVKNGSNFHLQMNSRCKDAGIDVGLTNDLEGFPVPYGKLFDIGAYEYHP